MNTYVKYESPISYGSKVMVKVNFFFNLIGQGHKVKQFGTDGKVLSQGIHM